MRTFQIHCLPVFFNLGSEIQVKNKFIDFFLNMLNLHIYHEKKLIEVKYCVNKYSPMWE